MTTDRAGRDRRRHQTTHDLDRKEVRNAMNHLQIEQRFASQRRQRDLQRAGQERLARRSQSRRPRPPVRRAFGRSLVRLGSRLAGESDPSFEPARSP